MANLKTNREPKNTNPLLGLDWMKHFGFKLDTEKTNQKNQSIQEDPVATEWKETSEKYFTKLKQ